MASNHRDSLPRSPSPITWRDCSPPPDRDQARREHAWHNLPLFQTRCAGISARNRTDVATSFISRRQQRCVGFMVDSYSQTAKGKAEFAAKPGALTPGLKTLLGMVGDKTTIADLKVKLPQVPMDKLMPALDKLVADGYLQRNAAPVL